MKKYVFIWLHELFAPDGNILLGGVQTYLRLLNRALVEEEYTPVVVYIGAADSPPAESRFEELICVGIPARTWWSGRWEAVSSMFGSEPIVHIVGNVHAMPRLPVARSIGIQHGIYWDRTSQRASHAARVAPQLLNVARAYRGYSCINLVRLLVCVDANFPNSAAAFNTPFRWEACRLIPNCSDHVENIAFESEQWPTVNRIVFVRRFDRIRGTELFVEAMQSLVHEFPSVKVEFWGEGPEASYLHDATKRWPNVSIGRLAFGDRLSAFDPATIAVVPSLASEGTSLTAIEAYSKGALVVASAVGGLPTIVINHFTGLLARPVPSDFEDAIRTALRMDRHASLLLQKRGHELAQTSLRFAAWKEQWLRAITEVLV